MKKTERHQRNESILADWTSEVYLSFCAFATGDFQIIAIAVSKWSTDDPQIIWWHAQPSDKFDEKVDKKRPCLMKMVSHAKEDLLKNWRS